LKTVAWWHCFAGIAGDMALGALVDAGADLSHIERELVALPVGGWTLSAESVLRSGVAATQVRVHVRDTRRPVSQVHFHEVGGIDAIIDIIGTCVALEILGVDEVRSSAVAQGTGMVSTAHGALPIPAPAVVKLLEGAPTYGTSIPFELCTPTGAALLASLCQGWGPMPAMTITGSGFGAGTRELDGMPNVAQVVVGQMPDAGPADLPAGQPIVELQANIDDVTGEILGATLSALMAAGALDAWVTPVTGKKGRPAHVVSLLCDPARIGRLRQVLADETGTLGIRAHTWERWPYSRQFATVEVGGYPVQVKRGPRRIKAEHDDAVRVARLVGLPVREVARQAEEAAHRLFDGLGAEPGGVASRPPDPDPAGPEAS
jgi:uncharacterized protein (TIGR00299 family) protein